MYAREDGGSTAVSLRQPPGEQVSADTEGGRIRVEDDNVEMVSVIESHLVSSNILGQLTV